MSAEILRQAATLMRERASATADDWAVDCWRPSLSELADSDGYRTAPVWQQNHVATDDVHGSVILASPWTDRAATIHAASWHPAVALAVADWLDVVATRNEELPSSFAEGSRAGAVTAAENTLGWNAALTVARAYLGGDQ